MENHLPGPVYQRVLLSSYMCKENILPLWSSADLPMLMIHAADLTTVIYSPWGSPWRQLRNSNTRYGSLHLAWTKLIWTSYCFWNTCSGCFSVQFKIMNDSKTLLRPGAHNSQLLSPCMSPGANCDPYNRVCLLFLLSGHWKVSVPLMIRKHISFLILSPLPCLYGQPTCYY